MLISHRFCQKTMSIILLMLPVLFIGLSAPLFLTKSWCIDTETLADNYFDNGMTLFKDKQYDKAVPYLKSALEEYKKLDSDDTEIVKKKVKRIENTYTKLAGYYRWVKKQPETALAYYSNLIEFSKKNQSLSANFMVYFLMGEICEKDMNDHSRAYQFYDQAKRSLMQAGDLNPKTAKLNRPVIQWLNFLMEKINVINLNHHQSFSKRTLKYPNIDYIYFLSFFCQYHAFDGTSFIEEDFANHANDYYSTKQFDALVEKYPNAYQHIFIGFVLFYHLVEKNDLNQALQVAEKMIQFQPYDLNILLLHFKIAEILLNHKQLEAHHEWIVKGMDMANVLNVTMKLGPDWRFSNPEATWKHFVDALKTKDMDILSECFSPNSRQFYQNYLSKSLHQFSRIASRLKLGENIKADKNSAQYLIESDELAKQHLHRILFFNYFGEWKIEGLDMTLK